MKRSKINATVASPAKFVSDNTEHLPSWEIVLSFCIWILHAIWCFYAAFLASRQNLPRLYARNFVPGWTWVFGPKIRYDQADFEWKIYNERLPMLIICFCLRYLMRQILMGFAGNRLACMTFYIFAILHFSILIVLQHYILRFR